MFEGSLARVRENPSRHAYQSDLRPQLAERGVLEADGDILHFTQDFRFNSPTMAAAVLIGGNYNGRTAWKTAQSKTLKRIQVARADTMP